MSGGAGTEGVSGSTRSNGVAGGEARTPGDARTPDGARPAPDRRGHAAAGAPGGRQLALPAPLLMVFAALSVQGGAGLAVGVIDRAGPLIAVWLRLGFGALVLAVLRPPWRSVFGRGAWRTAILFGVVLAAMNTAFYEAIGRIPLGVAVTFEFWGPLAVGVLGSRRRLDLVWVVFAAVGIFTLAGGRLNAGDALGVLFALTAGACWALYILTGARLTRAWPDGRGLGLAMLVGAALLAVPAIADRGTMLVDPWVLGAGLVVALFSSVIPYTLELAALRSLPPGVFGVLTSLDPAFAALVGFVALRQALDPSDLAAIAMVIAASAGASLGAARRPHPFPEEPLVVAD